MINEIKLPINVFKNRIYRVGENHPARDLQIDNEGVTITIRLYDENIKLIRELGAQRQSGSILKITRLRIIILPAQAAINIFVIDSKKETFVMVYNQSGVQLGKVKPPLPPLKMTTALKEVILQPFRGSPSRWKEIEKRVMLPGQTPGLNYFEVVDGKFVTRTYHYRENSVEFVIFDSQGRELKRMFLPQTNWLANGSLFFFFKGFFYYLKENPDEEAWELHKEKVW